LGYNTCIHGNDTIKHLYSYLKQKNLLLVSFFLYKIPVRKAKGVLSGGRIPAREGEYKERGLEDEYTVNIMHTYINGKMRSVKIIIGMWAGEIKENNGTGKFNYDIL
jgi:hypothetical protein